MKKTTFTLMQSKTRYILSSFAFLALMFLSNTVTTAQCSLACNTNTQVSLDETGNATITAAMILQDSTTCPGGDFEVRVYEYGTTTEIVGSPNVDCTYEGQSITVGIWDLNSGNNCWGTLAIEDKLAPVFTCPSDTMVIGCAEIINFDPVVTDNCDPDPTISLISEIEEPLDCDTLFIKRVTRTYQAVDNKGMVSQPCTIVFNLERIKLDSIVWPVSYDIAPGNKNPLSCSDIIPLDSNGHPDPLYTGVPTLFGDSLWPNNSTFCNSATFYNDLVIPTVGCTKKIMRTWSVREWWCSQELERTVVQVIETNDTIAPVITCGSTINITTTPSGCDVNLFMPEADVTDNCSTDITVKMTYPGGFLNSNGGIITLPVGTSVVTYTAHDGCGNYSSCEITVNVEDHTPPVPVCVQFIAVSLTIGGESWIPAESFNDGSFDECAIDRVEVKRMDDGDNCDIPNHKFGPNVPVCCNDIGQETVIIMRVWDKAGNWNECMVNVDVQDKLAPVIICPADQEVDCGTFYDPEDLGATFGEATVYDNCDVTFVETFTTDFNACGIGRLTRTITATDAGNRVTSCDQHIDFNPIDPFVYNDITWPNNPDALEGCEDPAYFTPEVTGYPTYTEEECDLVGLNYKDEVFFFNQAGAPACFKILRHWSVIDWCTYEENFYDYSVDYDKRDPNGNGIQDGIWRHDQVIKIKNSVDPVITSSCEPLSTCTYDAACAEGYIELIGTATDDCTTADNLAWEYRIDFNKDNVVDSIRTGTGGTVNASGDYPIGEHSIAWRFFDKCGNTVTCVQDFNIVNCKAPTPYCLNGLAIDLMPIDTDNDGEIDAGMVETWASDFDAGSFHPCGYPVILSFSADTSEHSALFTCDDVGQQSVNIYASVVTPTGLIQAWCETYVIIQDNMNACSDDPDGLQGNISGMIATETNATINNVHVVLEQTEGMTTLTNDEGMYSFPDMPLGGSYVINPDRNSDPMEGVSTLDLILIQRHILKLKEFETPYKVIAADIDRNGTLNALDLVSLRKVILGKTDEFPNNESWRFIDASYDFQADENPLQTLFPEEYNIEGMNAAMVVNFIAVKTGDVDNTISDDLLGNNDSDRFSTSLKLQTEDKSFEAGELVSISFNVAQEVVLNGYQFTIDFDQTTLLYDGQTSNTINVNDNNFGLNLVDRGLITTSWSTEEAVKIDNNESIFTLEFIAKKAGNITDVVGINSNSIPAEAYDNNFDKMNIEFNTNKTLIEGYELYQNTPNPFTDKTSIAFNLPVSDNVTLKIYDVTGRMLKVIKDTYTAGRHAVEINTNEINASGVVYYTLESENFTSTKRMVIIK